MTARAPILCLGEPLFELADRDGAGFIAGVGGDISNVAVTIARQGGAARVISRLGDDTFGRRISDLWRAEGVDGSLTPHVPGEDTGLYFVTYEAGEHHFTYRRAGSAASRRGPADLDPASIERAGMLYTSGITLAIGEAPRAAAAEAVRIARAAGVPVAVDPNLRTRLWPLEQARKVTHALMRDADIALPGLDDARQLTGLDTPEEITAFYHDLGTRIVALTLGAEGVLLSDEGRTTRIAPVPVAAVDATGAGDCFNGIFLSHLLATGDAPEAARRANAGAALSTLGRGAISAIPSPDDITRTITQQKE